MIHFNVLKWHFDMVFAQEYESKDDPERNRTSFKQSKKSEVRLEKLVTDGTTLVTNVKIAGDSKEVARRQDGEEAKKARYKSSHNLRL